MRSPAQQLGRITTREVEIGGQRIPEGERVLLSFGAANHDPGKFDHPDELDLDRGCVGTWRSGGASISVLAPRWLARS